MEVDDQDHDDDILVGFHLNNYHLPQRHFVVFGFAPFFNNFMLKIMGYL
jgi:hypothetical protein